VIAFSQCHRRVERRWRLTNVAGSSVARGWLSRVIAGEGSLGAEVERGELQGQARLVGDVVQDGQGLADHLGPDAVPRDHADGGQVRTPGRPRRLRAVASCQHGRHHGRLRP